MQRNVYFLLLPGVLSLDLTGPAETLRLAGSFNLCYISPLPEVMSSTDMMLGQLQPLPDSLPEGSLLVVPGVSDSRHYFATETAAIARRWLQKQKAAITQQKTILVCVCSGSIAGSSSWAIGWLSMHNSSPCA